MATEVIGGSLERVLRDTEQVMERRWAQPEAFEREQRQCRAARAADVRRRLPPVLQRTPVPELEQRISHDLLRRLARGWDWSHGNVLALGPTGIGKTTACAVLVRLLLAAWVRDGGEGGARAAGASWWRADDLEQARREHPLGRGDAPELIDAAAAELLVLDDAGQDRDVQAVSQVLTARGDRGLPTIVTSGRTRAELTEHYGAAIVRRMVEAGGRKGVVLNCFPKAAR